MRKMLLNIRSSKITVNKKPNDWKLLIDGDMLLYRAAWATDKESEMNSKSSFIFILYGILDRLDSDDYVLYMSGKRNYRKDVWPLYKANRSGKRAPTHINSLREFVFDMFTTKSVYGYEADDAIAEDHDPDKTIIVSLDKDFDQLVGFHYRFNKQCGLYWVNQEEADFFSSKQVLMGDRIDNIPGLSERFPKRGIGDVRATKMLTPFDRDSALETILSAYREKYDKDAELMIAFNTYLLALGIEGRDVWRRELEDAI